MFCEFFDTLTFNNMLSVQPIGFILGFLFLLIKPNIVRTKAKLGKNYEFFIRQIFQGFKYIHWPLNISSTQFFF